MSEPIEPQPRLGKNDKEKIAELERVVKALLTAIQGTEKATGEALMPEGEYYGFKFE